MISSCVALASPPFFARVRGLRTASTMTTSELRANQQSVSKEMTTQRTRLNAQVSPVSLWTERDESSRLIKIAALPSLLFAVSYKLVIV